MKIRKFFKLSNYLIFILLPFLQSTPEIGRSNQLSRFGREHSKEPSPQAFPSSTSSENKKKGINISDAEKSVRNNWKKKINENSNYHSMKKYALDFLLGKRLIPKENVLFMARPPTGGNPIYKGMGIPLCALLEEEIAKLGPENEHKNRLIEALGYLQGYEQGKGALLVIKEDKKPEPNLMTVAASLHRQNDVNLAAGMQMGKEAKSVELQRSHSMGANLHRQKSNSRSKVVKPVELQRSASLGATFVRLFSFGRKTRKSPRTWKK